MKRERRLEARRGTGKIVRSGALLVLAVFMALSSVVSVHAIKPPREKPPKVSHYNDFYSAPPGYQNYNCYAYAIGKKTQLYPGQLSGYPNPIDREETNKILSYIMQDLSACGYTNIRKVSSSYVLRPGESLLAFVYGDLDAYGNEKPMGKDLHAWIKRSNDDYWYHKMGTGSAIMRMKEGVTPQTSGKTNEYYRGDGTFVAATNFFITDVIYFFAFTTALSVNGEPEQEQEG